MKRIVVVAIALFAILSLSAQSSVNKQFFDQVDAFLKKHVSNNGVNYVTAKNDPALASLIDKVANASVSGLDAQTTQAFYINAYNLLVIEGVAQAYPLQSVLDQGGFFDTQKKTVAGKKLTLNQLEKDLLLKQYGDARFHFVLVCGAVGCPPITNFAYRPESLELQLNQQTRKALNNPTFIQVNEAEQKVELSQIFEWYAKDFGGGKAEALAFINKYRTQAIPASYSIGFYTYDWKLNEANPGTGQVGAPSTGGGNNSLRYVVSAAIPKGTTETKLFNNLYSQTTTDNGDGPLVARSTFFTSNLSFLYGLTNRFNLGIDARYRRVRNDALPSTPLDVFGGRTDASSVRQGLTTLGPKIRWAPFERLPNFSIQSTVMVPLRNDFEGTGNLPFIDWNNTTWWTQFFNDKSIGSNFSLFTEVDFLIEDIGRRENGAFNRISTPATVILSYFPTPMTTIYALSGFSPFWQENFDYFAQAGIGAKYQITRKFELELLYTSFTNQFLEQNNGRASTFNFGIRFNR